MPTYSYKCRECGHEFDTVQKITEDALTECPECSKEGLYKVISPANFLLKGSGWFGRSHVSGKPKRFKRRDTDGDSS